MIQLYAIILISTHFKVVDVPSLQAFHLHHSAIRRSLLRVWRCRLCVWVQPIQNVKSTPKPRKVRIDHRIPLSKVHSTSPSTSKTTSTSNTASTSKSTSKASLRAHMPQKTHQKPQLHPGLQ